MGWAARQKKAHEAIHGRPPSFLDQFMVERRIVRDEDLFKTTIRYMQRDHTIAKTHGLPIVPPYLRNRS